MHYQKSKILFKEICDWISAISEFRVGQKLETPFSKVLAYLPTYDPKSKIVISVADMALGLAANTHVCTLSFNKIDPRLYTPTIYRESGYKYYQSIQSILDTQTMQQLNNFLQLIQSFCDCLSKIDSKISLSSILINFNISDRNTCSFHYDTFKKGLYTAVVAVDGPSEIYFADPNIPKNCIEEFTSSLVTLQPGEVGIFKSNLLHQATIPKQDTLDPNRATFVIQNTPLPVLLKIFQALEIEPIMIGLNLPRYPTLVDKITGAIEVGPKS